MGPTVLREKGLYDSDRDSLCVAWKPRRGPDRSLRLAIIQIPSPGSDHSIAGEEKPDLLGGFWPQPRRRPALPCLRFPLFAAWPPPSRVHHLGRPTRAGWALPPTGRPDCGCSTSELTLPGTSAEAGGQAECGWGKVSEQQPWLDGRTPTVRERTGPLEGEEMSRPLEVVQAGGREEQAGALPGGLWKHWDSDSHLPGGLVSASESPWCSQIQNVPEAEGKRKVSLSIFPTPFYKTQQLALPRVHGSKATPQALETIPRSAPPSRDFRRASPQRGRCLQSSMRGRAQGCALRGKATGPVLKRASSRVWS